MTEQDKLILAGDFLKSIISDAQAVFTRANCVITSNYPDGLTDEQARKIDQTIIKATIDIVAYKDLLRRLYEALGITNLAE